MPHAALALGGLDAGGQNALCALCALCALGGIGKGVVDEGKGALLVERQLDPAALGEGEVSGGAWTSRWWRR